MQVYDFLVVISLFSIGFIPYLLVKRFINFKIDLFDSFITIIIFSFSLICFPLIIFGTRGYSHLFKYYTLFLTLISLSFIIYYVLRNFHNLFKIINYYEIEDSRTYRVIGIFFGIAVFTYLFHVWILPLRGYDALYLYFPNALLFNLTHQIPLFNPLNFYPVIKEPLNTLIYSYSLEIVNHFSVDLVILLVILLWAFVTYRLTLLFFPGNRNLASLSFLMFLFFPLNFWFIEQWFYYQDIFLGFFFTCTLYFILQSFDASNSRSQTIFHAVMSGLSFSLSLISKSSGWILIFIILAFFLIYSSHQTTLKVYYILLFSILTIVGFSKYNLIIIPFFLIVLGITIYHSTSDKSLIKLYKSNRLATVFILGIGIVLGGYWFYYIFTKFSSLFGPTFTQLLVTSYVTSSTGPATAVASTSIYYTFENAHTVTPYSTFLVLIIGNLFAIFYAIPKVLSLLKRSSVSVLIVWVSIFFSFWVVFDSGSIRYLTPVVTPLIIITIQGLLIAKSKLNYLYQTRFNHISDAKEEIVAYFSTYWILFILVLGLASLYLPIPLSTILSGNQYAIPRAYLQTAYVYYSNWFLDICLLIFLPLLVYYIILKYDLKLPNLQKLPKYYNTKIKTFSFALMLIILISFPNFVLAGTLYSANFNVSQAQQDYSYDYRPQVQQLVNVLYSSNDITGGVMVYDTPGIPVWVGNPTFDIYSSKDMLKPLFSSNNITEGLGILLDPYSYLASIVNYSLPAGFTLPTIDFVVIPNVNNLYYTSFMNTFRNLNYFFAMVQNPHYFSLYYQNSDFLVYKREFTTPSYQGIYDLGLTFNQKQIPVLGSVPHYDNLYGPVDGYAKFYYLPGYLQSNFSYAKVYINTTIINKGIESTSQNTINLNNLQDQFNITWPILKTGSFSLLNVSLSLVFYDMQSSRHIFSWSFDTNSTINIINNNSTHFSIYSTRGMSYA